MSYKAEKSFAEKVSGVAFVIIFHLLVIYGLAVGLDHDPIEIFKTQIEAKVIEENIPPPPDEPPPPPVEIEPPPPDYVPPPDFEVTSDAPPVETATAITVTQKAPPPPTPSTVGARTPKKGLSRPPYPSASQRLGEEGVVGLQLYLGPDGKVQDGKVEKSSGFERLDTAALKHAMRSWKFEPCMSGDKPVACWHRINFRFTLADAKG